ncbi:hypothetical protein J437_LFUL001174, partial [Ladona fulva]
MDIQHKAKAKQKISSNLSEFPHDIHFYLVPPAHEISLVDFYDLAFNRLKILRLIEEVTLRGKTKYSEDWRNTIINEIRKLGLKKIAALYSSSGSNASPVDEVTRREDNISHYLLRLAYSVSAKNQPWFISREIDLFRLRFGFLSKEGLHNFVEFNKFDYFAEESFIKDVLVFQSEFFGHQDVEHGKLKCTISCMGAIKSREKRFNINSGFWQISDEEKMQVMNQLVQCCSGVSTVEIESNEYYKVSFQNVPELIRQRKVFLKDGFAYVAASDLVFFFTQQYRNVLTKGLQSLARIAPLLDGDSRLAPLFNGIHDVYMGRDYSKTPEDQATILPEEIDQLAMESFPPCMQRLHSILRSSHHLHHFGRLRYTLFLKGAGLSYDDAMAFFKDEYTKINPDKFEKEYSYTIRHSYGKVGNCRDYTPYSCVKLITDAPQEGSCPFKYDTRQNLHKWLSSLGSNSQGDAQNILQSVDNEQYGQACSRYFELIHGEGPESIISHPNQFFEESYRLRTGKERKETGKAKKEKPARVSIKENN